MAVNNCFADIILDIPANAVRDRLFTYAVPDDLLADVSLGVPVLVPFGKSRTIAGYVVSISHSPPHNIQTDHIELREIISVLDQQAFFDAQYIEFLKWIADYYLSSLMDVITAALPGCLVPRLKQSVRLKEDWDATNNLSVQQQKIIDILKQSKTKALSVTTLKQKWCKTFGLRDPHFYKHFNPLLAQEILERKNSITAGTKIKSKQVIRLTSKAAGDKYEEQVLAVLTNQSKTLTKTELMKLSKVGAKKLNKLIDTGFLALSEEFQVRDPLQHLHQANEQLKAKLPKLTDDQTAAFDKLTQALEFHLSSSRKKEVEPWLLHGVTGSGKTEIYLRLILQTLEQNRTALLLVPEIALTPQLAHRLVERFGKQVAVWHSGLSDGERFDTWRRLQNGELKILLGARSAILVNIPNLGLIIIDEEHDASYKQTSPSPRYNAKTLALEKAKLSNALLLLGSATPDIATYYAAIKADRILALPRRVFDQGFPQTIIADMRQEFASGNRSIFSRILEKALNECIEKKEQAILLLNRRGYASHVFCRACGYVSTCKNCSVPMVYHRLSTANGDTQEVDWLICHHCGSQSRLSHSCPSCQQPFLKNYGLGTQRVELELKASLPQAKIIRLDSDVAQKKGAHEEVFNKFTSGQADILIGTQMIAKGLDNANVTLVGILAADAAFNLSDYRCTERGFQLLTQVAGRAGRGLLPGRVVVQTFNPELPALKYSLTHDYHSFYDAELPTREAFAYPPFSQLTRIVLAGEDLDKTTLASENLAESLSNYLADTAELSEMLVLGPAPCLLERLHGKYRQHIIVKNTIGEKGHVLIARFVKNKPNYDGVQIAIDMDAIDLL